MIVLGRGERNAQFVSGTDLTFPMYIAHRGSRFIYPEMSVEGQRAMTAKGYPTEVDVRALSDGTLVGLHDATVDRTMLGVSGDVTSLSVEDWRSARIKPAVPGGLTGTPLFFENWLEEMAQSGVTPVFEVKDDAIVDDVIAAVRRVRLERTVIAQSFTFEVAAKMARSGLRSLYLFGGWWAPEPNEEIIDAGIWGVGCNTSAADTSLQAYHRDGLAVIVYTINDPVTANDWISRPHVDGIFSDDPEYVSGRIVRRPSDTFASGYGSPGMEQYTYNGTGWATPIHLEGAALTIPRQAQEADGRPWVAIPELSPRTGNFRITFDIEYDSGVSGTSQNGSPGIILWKNTAYPGELWGDTAVNGQEGFTAVARRNGQLQAWKYVNGASASSVGASLVQSGSDQFAQEGRPGRAQVVFEVLDGRIEMRSPSHGYYVSRADTYAPSGLTFALRGDREMGVTFSNIRVVDL